MTSISSTASSPTCSGAQLTPEPSDYGVGQDFKPTEVDTTMIENLAHSNLNDDEDKKMPILHLQSVTEHSGIIASIQNPTAPSKGPNGFDRAPCDIVLVIDVSGSMGSQAPAPDDSDGTKEDYGLSVLDLTKHAARTVLEALNEGDRLAIIAYSSAVETVLPLTHMSRSNKAKATKKIEQLRPLQSTNMWHGILEGIKLFNNKAEPGRVPALMVLTDGMPNYMCPRKGYVPKLQEMGSLPASIHTFGFGYEIRSGLLKSIAEYGAGNYAFIPDAGMIGTVFVHAVANLQTTYATRPVLTLSCSPSWKLEEAMGTTVSSQEAGQSDKKANSSQLVIPMSNLQYGQSRNIFVKATKVPGAEVSHEKGETLYVTATLSYSPTTTGRQVTSAKLSSDPGQTLLSQDEVAYHVSRSQLCTFLSSFAPLNEVLEHIPNEKPGPDKSQELKQMIQNIPARNYSDPLNKSIMADISNVEPKGQVFLALEKSRFFRKWGIHYFPSLLNAHANQICNTFKDPGPLQYGNQSPMFVESRDRLDDAFETLPPPKPSLVNREGKRFSGRISMGRFHSSSNPCFAGSASVKLASGREVQIRRLRRGAMVATPLGGRRVLAVLATPVEREVMCRVERAGAEDGTQNGLLVTPWHPVSISGKSWIFPAQLAASAVRYTGCIYSILLQPHPNPSAHAIMVGGVWGVTLGHGITAAHDDPRAHAFLGDYAAVMKSLRTVGVRRGGLVVGGGIKRDEKTGRVNGFKTASSLSRKLLQSQATPLNNSRAW